MFIFLRIYNELIKGMKDEHIDIGLFGAFSYIIADSQQDLIPLLVKKTRDLGIIYNSLIISRADSGLKSIEDLKDRNIAFVNSVSTSGYMVPPVPVFKQKHQCRRVFQVNTFFRFP